MHDASRVPIGTNRPVVHSVKLHVDAVIHVNLSAVSQGQCSAIAAGPRLQASTASMLHRPGERYRAERIDAAKQRALALGQHWRGVLNQSSRGHACAPRGALGLPGSCAAMSNTALGAERSDSAPYAQPGSAADW